MSTAPARLLARVRAHVLLTSGAALLAAALVACGASGGPAPAQNTNTNANANDNGNANTNGNANDNQNGNGNGNWNDGLPGHHVDLDTSAHRDVQTPQAWVRVSAPAPGTFRVRLSQTSDFADVPSYAVDPAALGHGPTFTVDETATDVTVHIPGAALRVTKSPLHLALLDGSGNMIAEEAAPVAFQAQGYTLAWALAGGEHVYGLGDKVKGLDRRGQHFLFWNNDSYGWDPGTDPLYKSIPVAVMVGQGGATHGLFVDNPSRATMDVGVSAHPSQLLYAAERGAVADLYLFAGPDPHAVLSAYTALTGRITLPPRWALGYHQSRFTYGTETDARNVAGQLRADQLPADAIWFDIGFQANNAPFTVNANQFPDWAGMLSDFLATDLRTVVITDLHIPQRTANYTPYNAGLAGDHFIRAVPGTTSASGLYLGHVWPPEMCAFPEFTRARSRAFWGTLYQGFVDQGVAGFWNDMNEPALLANPNTFPDALLHRLDDGTTADHVQIHNAYGELNVQGTWEGQLALRPTERPFVLSRAGYAGSQRWGTTWTGDNTASREHLAVTIPQLTNLGVSGYAFSGADVGGFIGCPYTTDSSGNVLDGSLIVEWMELGALQPFYRNHSSNDTCRREPWLLGATLEARVRAGMERRYKLLPYLYTAFEEASRTGAPVMRPLWFEYPADASTYANDRAYLLGRDLLVAPKLVAGTGDYTVTLPAADWWDTRTGALVAGGGARTITPPADDSIRIFARAGAIVPQQPVMQAAGVTPSGALTLDVWPSTSAAGDCSGALYLDDGHSFEFRAGGAKLRRIAYGCQPAARGLTVTSATAEGTFPAWWSSTQVRLHGVPAAPSVQVNATPATATYDAATQTATVTVDVAAADWTLSATW